MKTIHLSMLLFIFVWSALADEVLELKPYLAEAASAQGRAYVEIRDRLVSTVSTNALFRAVDDERLVWRERLVARIVLERTLRGDDIQALRNYDWPKDPEFDPGWLNYVTGFAYDMAPLADPRLDAAGLWYYYLEINWKDTQETSHKYFGWRLAEAWPSYLLRAASRSPEGCYRHRVMMDRIASDPPPGKQMFMRFYDALINDHCSDAVPVLLVKMNLMITYAWPSDLSKEQISRADRSVYEKIVCISDQRHVGMLSQCIDERPALFHYREQLDQIRLRPVRKADDFEPPFRLMPTPDFLKTKPFVEEMKYPNVRRDR